MKISRSTVIITEKLTVVFLIYFPACWTALHASLAKKCSSMVMSACTTSYLPRSDVLWGWDLLGFWVLVTLTHDILPPLLTLINCTVIVNKSQLKWMIRQSNYFLRCAWSYSMWLIWLSSGAPYFARSNVLAQYYQLQLWGCSREFPLGPSLGEKQFSSFELLRICALLEHLSMV